MAPEIGLPPPLTMPDIEGGVAVAVGLVVGVGVVVEVTVAVGVAVAVVVAVGVGIEVPTCTPRNLTDVGVPNAPFAIVIDPNSIFVGIFARTGVEVPEDENTPEVNVTAIAQRPRAGICAPQSLVCENVPVSAIGPILIALVLGLTMLMFLVRET